VASGASIGVVGSDAGLATADDYLRAADAAMYRAKTGHLGVSVFAD
jgi:GGDEF domain-containing protein